MSDSSTMERDPEEPREEALGLLRDAERLPDVRERIKLRARALEILKDLPL